MFCTKRLEKGEKSVYDRIPKNFFPLMGKSMLIIDGGNLPYNHAPKTAMTFLEYGDQIFKKILNHCDNYQRVVIFDIYQPNSLKAATREKRGRVSKKECLKMQNVHQTGKAF